MSRTFHHSNAADERTTRRPRSTAPEFFVTRRALTLPPASEMVFCRCQEISFDVRYCPMHGHLFQSRVAA